MQRDDKTLREYEEKIKHFLNDKAFWGPLTRGGSFPKTVKKMQEIVNNPQIESKNWIFKFMIVQPQGDKDPNNASFFHNRKWETRKFYNAIIQSHSQPNERSLTDKLKPIIDCIDSLYEKKNLRETPITASDVVRAGAFVMSGM